ncbi:MAG: hypothetical protein M3381_08740 [Actinomycetota bacterium]|nr:hypothetical protein [Actinomycetota bacterium]
MSFRTGPYLQAVFLLTAFAAPLAYSDSFVSIVPETEEELRKRIAEEAERRNGRVADGDDRELFGRPVKDRLDFEEALFEDVLTSLAEASGVGVTADWDSLKDLGVDEATSVTFRITDQVTLGEALVLVLESLGPETTDLEYTVRDGVVVIKRVDPRAGETGKRTGKRDRSNAVHLSHKPAP